MSEEQKEEKHRANALSSCKDGVFTSPLQAPPCAVQQPQPSLVAATSGLSLLSKAADSGDIAVAAPLLWQDQKPDGKAVVTKDDFKAFQHFWLANVEKKLLVVAIPKVGMPCCYYCSQQ